MGKALIILFLKKIINNQKAIAMATKTETIINGLKTEIIRVVTEKLTSSYPGSTTHDVTTSWKGMQDVAAKEIRDLLATILPDSTITSPDTKSTYPDIKIRNTEGTFAIDIKVNEDSKEPWFDMARIDTMEDDRIKKFIEEWELVIKFRSTDGAFIKAYFHLFREVVGIRTECNGIKYRPYDGKVRPKSWSDFENNVIHWNTKRDFLEGIEKSLKHRWKENIKAHLIPKLSTEEKAEFKKLFEEENNKTIKLFGQ